MVDTKKQEDADLGGVGEPYSTPQTMLGRLLSQEEESRREREEVSRERKARRKAKRGAPRREYDSLAEKARRRNSAKVWRGMLLGLAVLLLPLLLVAGIIELLGLEGWYQSVRVWFSDKNPYVQVAGIIGLWVSGLLILCILAAPFYWKFKKRKPTGQGTTAPARRVTSKSQ